MVITCAFLAIFCIFFFLPVNFRIYYKKVAMNDQFIFEMTFLKGFIKRRKIVSILGTASENTVKTEKKSRRWFFLKKAQTKTEQSPRILNFQGLQEFLIKFQHFGFGVTLLFYFLPVKYQRWLLVAEDLEKRGSFYKFVWKTRFGTGEASGTSVLYGVLWGVKTNLVKYLQNKVGFARRPVLEITPDYQTDRLDTIFDCIFRIKLGYIIIASLIARFRLLLLKGGVF